MDDSDTPTCGKGLAAHATLPAALGAVAAAMSDVLRSHRRSLDPSEANGATEDDAYATLVNELRAAADALAAIAARMAAYRDLPMGSHDEAILGDEESVAVFEKLVAAERELEELLASSRPQNEEMLQMMRG